MTIRNVSYTPIATETHGGAGYGNTYRFRVSREVECGLLGSGIWVAQHVLSSCERDVAQNFASAGQPIPAELQGPYDCYGHAA
jgi:hypothetical protein